MPPHRNKEREARAKREAGFALFVFPGRRHNDHLDLQMIGYRPFTSVPA